MRENQLMRVRKRRWPAAAVLLLGLPPLPAAAQSEAQPVVKIQFSYSNPGARSLGLGGAFVALADDATAALSNPAGLVQLLEPEVSVEGRSWSYSTPYSEGGRIEGGPSGFGIDNVAGLRFAESEARTSGLSFLSYVYPAERWSFALFAHRLADFEFSGETQGIFGGGSTCCQRRFADQRFSNDLEILTYGAAAGVRLTDSLSLGLGLTLFDTSLTVSTEMFLPDDLTLTSLFGPNSYLPQRQIERLTSVVDNTDWGLVAGLLWKISPSWSVGAVFREGPETEFVNVLRSGPALEPWFPSGTEIGAGRGSTSFPDVWGLGLAYRSSNGRLTVGFEWDRVEYSVILEELGVRDQEIDDADELRLGGEWVLLKRRPIVALRLGGWLDPDHQIRARSEDPYLQGLMPPGEDELHLAFGLGLAFDRFQLDLGVDLSDLVDTASLSAVYRF